MHLTPNPLTPWSFKTSRACSSLVLTLTFLLVTTGCCSASHRKEKVEALVSEQNQLLGRLQTERSDATLVRKLKSDPALSSAEGHLSEAIQMLIESNETLKRSLLN